MQISDGLQNLPGLKMAVLPDHRYDQGVDNQLFPGKPGLLKFTQQLDSCLQTPIGIRKNMAIRC